MSDFVDEVPKDEVDEEVAAMFDLGLKKKKKKKKVVVEEAAGLDGGDASAVTVAGGEGKPKSSEDNDNFPPR